MSTESQTGSFHVYLQILKDFWPLAALAAALTVATGVRKLRLSYLQRTPVQVMTNLLFSAFMAGIMVVCVLCLAEWVLPPMSPKLEVGITLFIGIFGVKAIDMKIRSWWGLPTVDTQDPATISELRELLRQHDAKHSADKAAGKPAKPL